MTRRGGLVPQDGSKQRFAPYMTARRGFRDPLRMTLKAHEFFEFRSSGETKTFKPFKPLSKRYVFTGTRCPGKLTA